jgi:hypothetical protein
MEQAAADSACGGCWRLRFKREQRKKRKEEREGGQRAAL